MKIDGRLWMNCLPLSLPHGSWAERKVELTPEIDRNANEVGVFTREIESFHKICLLDVYRGLDFIQEWNSNI